MMSMKTCFSMSSVPVNKNDIHTGTITHSSCAIKTNSWVAESRESEQDVMHVSVKTTLDLLLIFHSILSDLSFRVKSIQHPPLELIHSSVHQSVQMSFLTLLRSNTHNYVVVSETVLISLMAGLAGLCFKGRN